MNFRFSRQLLFALPISIFFTFYSYGGIMSLTGTTNICPNQVATYSVNFVTYFDSFTPREFINSIIWEFSQNGQVFKTINSSGFASIALTPSNASISTSNLPFGTITVTVKLLANRVINGFSFNLVYSNTTTTFCGLAQPNSIIGNRTICPGTTQTYSVNPVPNATSYTWEVPGNWEVNGVKGPIVIGQGNSVSISIPACINQAGYNLRVDPTYYSSPFSTQIKVKAISATCGTSNYQVKQLNVDNPINIESWDNGMGQVTFSVAGNFSSFYWDIPIYWNIVRGSLNDPSITVNHNEFTWSVGLSLTSNCSNCVYTSYKEFSPLNSCTSCPLPIAAYPNPATNILYISILYKICHLLLRH